MSGFRAHLSTPSQPVLTKFTQSAPRAAGLKAMDSSRVWNLSRYSDGQRIYIRECNPVELASVVIENVDLAHPFIVSWPHQA